MENMTSEELYELLEKIKNKPSMYIGTKSIIKLKHFLDGVLCALYCMNKQDASADFLQGFQEWIQIRYDIASSHHWSSIINFFSSNEAEAFDMFYNHLAEFLSLDKEARDYKTILKNSGEWLELKSEYWKKYNKIRF